MELGRYYRIYEWPHAANLRSGSYYLYTFPIWAITKIVIKIYEKNIPLMNKNVETIVFNVQ